MIGFCQKTVLLILGFNCRPAFYFLNSSRQYLCCPFQILRKFFTASYVIKMPFYAFLYKNIAKTISYSPK